MLFLIEKQNESKILDSMKTTEAKSIRDKIVEAIKIFATKFVWDKKESGQKIIISESGFIRVINPE
jgi:hypothetical protein